MTLVLKSIWVRSPRAVVPMEKNGRLYFQCFLLYTDGILDSVTCPAFLCYKDLATYASHDIEFKFDTTADFDAFIMEFSRIDGETALRMVSKREGHVLTKK
ncbi:MAG TPA: hypothetical protein VK158_01955 [Acidobacteriota bacterium]|nr:hypothetical protein [Acidobacteriota bacterium]